MEALLQQRPSAALVTVEEIIPRFALNVHLAITFAQKLLAKIAALIEPL